MFRQSVAPGGYMPLTNNIPCIATSNSSHSTSVLAVKKKHLIATYQSWKSRLPSLVASFEDELEVAAIPRRHGLGGDYRKLT